MPSVSVYQCSGMANRMREPVAVGVNGVRQMGMANANSIADRPIRQIPARRRGHGAFREAERR